MLCSRESTLDKTTGEGIVTYCTPGPARHEANLCIGNMQIFLLPHWRKIERKLLMHGHDEFWPLHAALQCIWSQQFCIVACVNHAVKECTH